MPKPWCDPASGIYYANFRIPTDLVQHFGRTHINKSLRTKLWGGISFGTGVVSQARGGKPRGDWDSGRIKAGADLRQISSEVRKNRADLQLI